MAGALNEMGQPWGQPAQGGLLPPGPLGTIGAMGSDFSPWQRRIELEARLRTEMNRMLAGRNALARAGLRGEIDPATMTQRRDPYSKIEGVGGGGGILDAAMEAERGAGPMIAERQPYRPTLKQEREARREKRGFEQDLRRMPDAEREEALARRAFERDPARKIEGIAREDGERRAQEREGRQLERGAAGIEWASSRGAEIVGAGQTIAEAVAAMRAEAAQDADVFSRAAKHRAIEAWASEQEASETRAFQRETSEEQRSMARRQAERAEETIAERKASEAAETTAAQLVAEHVASVPMVEQVSRAVEDAPGLTRQEMEEVPLSPVEWGERAYRQIAGLVNEQHPNAPRIRAAIAKQIGERVKLQMKQQLDIHKQTLDQIKQQFDMAQKQRAGDIASQREMRATFDQLTEFVTEMTTGLTLEGRKSPLEASMRGEDAARFEEYKKMLQESLRMMGLMLAGYKPEKQGAEE